MTRRRGQDCGLRAAGFPLASTWSCRPIFLPAPAETEEALSSSTTLREGSSVHVRNVPVVGDRRTSEVRGWAGLINSYNTHQLHTFMPHFNVTLQDRGHDPREHRGSSPRLTRHVKMDGISQRSRGLGGGRKDDNGGLSQRPRVIGHNDKENKEPSAVGAGNDRVNKRSRGLGGVKENEDEIVKHCGSHRQRQGSDLLTSHNTIPFPYWTHRTLRTIKPYSI